MENKKQISHEGELHLGGMSIPCYILEDGTRVLSGNAMQNALKLQDESDNASGTRLARYLNHSYTRIKHLAILILLFVIKENKK